MVNSAPSKWFSGSDKDESLEQSLKEVKLIEESHEGFRNRVVKLLGRSQGPRRVKTKEELEDQLEAMKTSELSGLLSGGLDSVLKQKEAYSEERKSGAKKIGLHLQNFFNTFAEFVGAYSGVVSLIKNAGAPCGEAAYETLSLLLVVVHNKAQNDTTINNFLEELTIAFPQLETLVDIYPSTSLEKQVAAVYREIIIVARKMTEYFARFFVRFVSAIAKVPSLSVEEAINTIKSHLIQVNKEAMILLHKRNQAIHDIARGLEVSSKKQLEESANLQRSNRELQLQNQELMKKLEELHRLNKSIKFDAEARSSSNDQQRLDALRHTLGFTSDPNMWSETDVSALYESLCQTFPGCLLQKASPRRSPVRNFHDMTCEKLFADESYQHWIKSNSSLILFACGTTALESRTRRQARHSWLSPAAVFAAAKFKLANQSINELIEEKLHDHFLRAADEVKATDLHLFYTCQPHAYEQRPFHYDTLNLFGFLAWSICQWRKPDIMPHIEDAIAQAAFATQLAAAAESSEKKKDIRVKSLVEMADMIIKITDHITVGDHTIWLLLDRLDQCDLPTSKIMKQLVRIVEHSRVKIKIFSVNEDSFNGPSWEGEDEDKILHRQDWNQTRLRTFERN